MGKNFCLLIICVNLLFGADVKALDDKNLSLPFSKSDEYIFWAKIFTTNHILSTYKLQISKAMKKNNQAHFVYSCKLNTPKKNNQSELEYFKKNAESLADCFVNSQIYVVDSSVYKINSMQLKTNITQLPIHFVAVFKPDGAIIFSKN